MVYSHNIVTRTIAYIFVNTECKGVPYNNSKECGNKAIEFFKGVLEFQEVSIFCNLTKTEVINKLNILKQIATNFEKDVLKRIES